MTGRTDVGTVEDLHESATKVTGLDDFGSDEDNYREALTVLLDSYRREADLTPLGSKMNRFFLRGALVARLLSEAAWKQYPEHADVVIERPIFVTGLVRTGTTALHRLLGADPAHQGLQMWLAEYPQPARPARPGNQIRCIASSTPSTPATTRRTRLHRAALHGRCRARGMLAAAATVVSFGVVRNAGPPAQLCAVAGRAGLDAGISAAPQKPSADRAQRRRQAVGVEKPQPFVRSRRAHGDLPRRAGDTDASAGRDDHGLDVLVGAAHHRGLVEYLRGRADWLRRNGNLVARAGTF
ncbi:hypothetical protein I553_5489 [Mycobacterium xenopi 4042]|uniref:Sulfotransferase family protein n=1 Tax=Mycobacterium xenopi 4042 TaxID=1299334 RepID=X7ZU92_MYCXE|nr:hypothetical protein I553_5489 [Mycobacterium xenopi 4042]